MTPWAVFDLDKTIIDHDTFSRFLRHLLARRGWRGVASVAALPVALPMSLTRRWKKTGASLLLWIATVGVDDAELAAIVAEYVEKLDVPARCYPAAVTEIRAHLNAGRRVLVVTASANLLAVPIVARIDPRIEVRASTLRRHNGGLTADHHAYGAGKIALLDDIDAPVVSAYSDSLSDLPLLRIAGEAVLVNASPAQQEIARASLNSEQGMRTVRWTK